MSGWRWLCAAVAVPLTLAAAGTAQAQNITYSEFKFGVLYHDPKILAGKEHGADLNPEFIWQSPVTDAMIADIPAWARLVLQPRPTIGAAINTAGDTDQAYVGVTWSWFLLKNIVNPDDGIALAFFFGPGFNDGKLGPPPPGREALGSHVLFREAVDLGYQINQTWEISAYIDHISNGGLAQYNQSLNNLGLRLGYRF